MATTHAPQNPILGWEKLREEWVERLSVLVHSVEDWATERGWSTRRIEKNMEDSQIGSYQAPALLLQEGFTRVLLEPIARFAPGTEGVVDLYLMPAYDDIATLYFCNNVWNLQYMFPDKTTGPDEPRPLSKETLQELLDQMRKNAA
jgi:hypothetical protein